MTATPEQILYGSAETPAKDAPTTRLKTNLRQELEADMQAFLDAGGKVRVVDSAISGITDYARFATNSVLAVAGDKRQRMTRAKKNVEAA